MLKLVASLAAVAAGSIAAAQCDPAEVSSIYGVGWFLKADEGRIVQINGNLLQVLDASGPSIQLLGSAPIAGNDSFIDQHDVLGDLAAVPHRGGLTFYDISDGSDIETLTTYLPDGFNANDIVGGVLLRGQTAYMTIEEHLFILDITDPAAPAVAWEFDDLPGDGSRIFFQNDLLMVICDDSDVAVVNVIDPSLPFYVGSYNASFNGAESYDLAGGKLYAVDSGEVIIIDVSDPRFPQLYAEMDIDATAVVGQGDLMYAGNDDRTLLVYDVSGDEPVLVSDVFTGIRAIGPIAIAGDVVSLVLRNFRLQQFDVSDPAAPVELGAYQSMGRVQDLVAANDVVYAVDDTLFSVDVADPTRPAVVGTTPLDIGTRSALDVTGDLAVVTIDEDLYTIDVTDPTLPVVLGVNGDMTYQGEAISMAGDMAYVVNPHVMAIFDLSDPTLPIIVDNYVSFNAEFLDIDVANGLAYLMSNVDGLRIIDITG